MTEPEPELSPEPAIGSLEWETGRRAAQMLAQDRARETLRKQEPEPVTAQWDPEADGRRATALQQAYAARGAVRMGQDASGAVLEVLPNGAAVAVHWKDGLIAELAPGVLSQVVVLPHEWDEHDREWQARQRLEENLVLSAAGAVAGVLRKAGLPKRRRLGCRQGLRRTRTWRRTTSLIRSGEPCPGSVSRSCARNALVL